jgi:leukotriene-A4 hydrolase
MAAPLLRVDECTLSNYTQASVQHSSLQLTVDFRARSIHGTVTHRVRLVGEGVEHVSFDTKFLKLRQVRVNGAWGASGTRRAENRGSSDA